MSKYALVLAALLLCFISTTNAEDLRILENTYIFNAYYDDLLNPGFKFSLSKGILYLELPELDDGKIENGFYIQKTINEPYQIKRDGVFTYIHTPSNKYLLLTNNNDICILVDCTSRVSFWGLDSKSPYVKLGKNWRTTRVGIRGGMNDYQKTSSYLTEKLKGKEVKYDGLSNYYFDLLVPWVEGKNGDGIGEWIQKNIAYETDKIVILNGFIDPQRPDLYTTNSRISDITIKTARGEWQYQLQDSPDPQILSLPVKVTGDVRLTIKGVYRGTKYTDTALAAVYFLEKS